MSIFDDTRADWSAAAPSRDLDLVRHERRVGRVWHWAGPALGLFGRPHTACLAKVRAWQRLHQAAPRLWKDIGYNGLICVHARAIEGRGLAYSGSHSPSWNVTRWGIQFMVGEGESVTPAMFARAARLAQDIEALAGHDLDDKSHLDDPAVSTACSGPQITDWVRAGGPETTPATTPGKDPLVDHTTFKRLVREVLAEPETARQIFAVHRLLVDPDVPASVTDLTKRVTPSNLLERVYRKVSGPRVIDGRPDGIGTVNPDVKR